MSILPAAALIVMVLAPGPPAGDDERLGPPLKLRTSRGSSGPVRYELYEEEYRMSDGLVARRHPYGGSAYATRPFRYAVMQGQAVYTYHDTPVHLIHNYTCEVPADAGQVPWTCRAIVFVRKGSEPWRNVGEAGRPRERVDEGITLVFPKDGAEVDGAFEEIAPHPSRELFAGIHHGCCDSPSVVSVYDFDGQLLCPPAELYLGDVETGPWDKLTIEDDLLQCPGGQRVPAPPTLSQDATELVRLHARRLLSRYRLTEPADVQGDWAHYASRHGHPPVFAYGDYNDDGFSDLAFLLPLRKPSRRGVGFGLFCLLSQDADSFRLVTVAEPDAFSLLPAHGLAVARPGPHSTDAIHMYAFEGAGVHFVWDAKGARFRRARIAD